MLPTFGLSTASPLPIPGYAAPLLGTRTLGVFPLGSPVRDPTVGVFIPDQNLSERLFDGGTHYQNPHHSYLANSFSIGVSAIGDDDAPIGIRRIPEMHPALPTDTLAASTDSNGVVTVDDQFIPDLSVYILVDSDGNSIVDSDGRPLGRF